MILPPLVFPVEGILYKVSGLDLKAMVRLELSLSPELYKPAYLVYLVIV